MRNFSQFCRKFVAASMLALALTCSTFAGDMQYPGVTAPPPPPPSATATGDMQFPNVASSTETADGDMQFPTVDSVKDMALVVWQSALALF